MRLLNTQTGQFTDINRPSEISYAILSHTWDLTGEQSYQDIRNIQGSHVFGGPQTPASQVVSAPQTDQNPPSHDESLGQSKSYNLHLVSTSVSIYASMQTGSVVGSFCALSLLYAFAAHFRSAWVFTED
jgi:hypothetical protein